MKKKQCKTMLYATLILLLVLTLNCTRKKPQENQKPLVIYANITSIEPVLDVFETQTGTSIDYNRISATDFLHTVFTQNNEGELIADIFQAPVTILDQLQKQNLLLPYRSNYATNLPEWAKRESDGIYKFAIEVVGIIYNNLLVDLNDVPNNYHDLTNEKWKNKIVMPNPEYHPTTISWLVALNEFVFNNNDDEWNKFIHGLAANNPLFVDSFTPSASVLISGERHIGISLPKYVVTNENKNLDWVKTESLLGSVRGIAISAKANNPVTAKLFIDYWLSDNVASFLANEVGEYVLNNELFPPLDKINEKTVIPIKELNDDELIYWGAYFKDIFAQ